MRRTNKLMFLVLAGLFIGSGCQSTPKLTVLPAPAGTNAATGRHNDEGIHAYQHGQWDSARQHFEAAITASPSLAEAHYNLGMVLFQVGREAEARPHFMRAADLALGNTVIWGSPALSSVTIPSKSTSGSSDGHGHSH